MAELLSIATAAPEHCVSAGETKRQLTDLLSTSAAARFGRMIDISQNETRYAVLPIDRLRRLQTLEDRNHAYRHHALRLGEAAARDALSKAGLDRNAVTAIVGVSSTGYLMPTLETHLLERLRLPAACRRVPLVQLGCAGGTAGLALAAALCDAAPSARILLVSVELPSLSYPAAEPSPTDVMAMSQFGDGAAAAVVSGGATADSPTVLASGSVLFPATVDRDGVQLTTAGLRLMRPRGLEDLLRRHLGDAVDRFLENEGLARRDVGFWIIHPRNPDLLDAAATSLDLPDAAVAVSRSVWRRHGNLISAAVFHVLRELCESAPPPQASLGMMVAFGAGFGCEMVLLRSGGWLSGMRTEHAPAVQRPADAHRGEA